MTPTDAPAEAEPPVSLLPDYARYLGYVVLRKPSEPRPLLVVLGDIEHFQSSALNKARRRTELFDRKALAEATDSELQHPSTRFIKWAPNSKYSITAAERLRLPASAVIINDTHFNCLKSTVHRAFEKVFGYGLRLDPLHDQGPAVIKSDGNATHDGRVISLPDTVAREGVVYERLITNEIGKDLVFDIRLPLFGDISPFAIVKFRPKSIRFANRNSISYLVSTSQILSASEMWLCRAFCREIGLHFGEIDVLRDKTSGKIYIVDANNTPVGPTKSLSDADRTRAIQLYGQAFSNSFFGTKY